MRESFGNEKQHKRIEAIEMNLESGKTTADTTLVLLFL
jgi:hypothetical protein